MKKEDPTEKHQKAIPMLVISALAKQQISKLDQAIVHLIGLGMFFGFQSCKYPKVSQAKNDKQKIYLWTRNIWFFKDGEIIPHTHPDLKFADCISITFKCQKKGGQTQHGHTGAIGRFGPVPHEVCRRICQAHLVLQRNGLEHSDIYLHKQWNNWACSINVGHWCSMQDGRSHWRTHLGITKNKIGTHSIRSETAMAICLRECRVYTIMLIGQWSSNAFLCYICKQVMELSHNVFRKMIQFKTHHHNPNFEHSIAPNNPRVRNDPNNTKMRRNISGDAS